LRENRDIYDAVLVKVKDALGLTKTEE